MKNLVKVTAALVLIVLATGIAPAADAKVESTLYVVAIGTNGSAKRTAGPRYPESDPQHFINLFAGQKGKLFEKIVPIHVNGNDVTRDRIVQELQAVQAKAKVGDMVVVFLTGHGGYDRNKEWGFETYCSHVTTDGLKLSHLRNTIGKLPATGVRTIMFLNTCHSGAVDLHKDGVVVFASSLPQESSFEIPGLGKGLYTMAVLEGLSGKGDLNRDGVVTVAELDLYVTERVDQLKKFADLRDPSLVPDTQRATCGRPTNVPGNMPLVKCEIPTNKK